MTAIEDVTEVKRAEFAHKLLARTGELLSHSSDYRATLEQVPRLLVPDFADWCSIEVPREDGEVEHVAIAHRDPERPSISPRAARALPEPVRATPASREVLESGEPRPLRDDRRAAAAARRPRPST